ncbi:MAG TPA: hypothetical protein VHV27_04070 [Phenylobacterium sp.]|nr:hypothetical protein [Phenylobacterium sp.]
MLVYGDRSRTCAPRAMLGELSEALSGAERTDGHERHDLLTGALIAAGELAQGLADAEFEVAGLDHRSPIQDAAMTLCVAIARQLFTGGQPVRAEIAALTDLPLPSAIRCKTPEGYAFYAVYPESCFAAARSCRWDGPPLVIGLRSIGASLAATVAAAADGRAISLRPCGHPFARELRVSAALLGELRAHPGPFAVVDEGPGLSGSSFGAAADLLESLGVAPQRIVFLPSHANALGPQASARHRVRWATAERPVRTFEDLTQDDPLAGWFGDLIGPVVAVEDLCAGAWRRLRPPQTWPPVAASQERRKYRLLTGEGAYVARFAGLGAVGAAKLARARLLAAEGFVPEPLALRRGFLLEPWLTGGPLDPAETRRPRFLANLARYLGFRARCLPAGPEAGATLEELREMTVCNVAELWGQDCAKTVRERLAGLPRLAGELRRVYVDGRLQLWEWLRRPDGTLCKTDALDHAEAHDLVGCQDIAWDIAGAAVEFGLSPQQTRDLATEVAKLSDQAVNPEAVAGFQLCYAALQAGAWSLAEAGADACEARRIAARRTLYAEQFKQPA